MSLPGIEMNPVSASPRPPVDVTVVSTPRNWAALLVLLLVAGVCAALKPLATGLLGALVLYVLVESPYSWLVRRTRPSVAATITTVGALTLIVGPLTWLAIVVIGRAPNALRAGLASPVLIRIGQLHIGSVRLSDEVAKASGAIIGTVSSQIATFVGTAASLTINLVVALFGLFYLLRASAGTWAAVREYIPFSARTADALRDRFIGATRATVLGTGMAAVTQGALIAFGFAVTGLPEPLFWGTMAAFASVVPAIGATLVWLPGVLLLVSQRQYGGAVAMFVIGALIAGNVDNVIRPLVYRRLSAMHPMITLVGVFAGIGYFGFIGLLLGPLAIVYVFELLRFYREEYGVAAQT
jgi:predicted PurR-regulated permease PerM